MKIYRDGVLVEDTDQKQPRDSRGRWSGWSKRKFVKKLKAIAWYVGLRAMVVFVAFAGVVAFAQYQISQAEPIVEVVHVEKIVKDNSMPPVLERIRKAESLGNHYCTEQLVKAKMCGKGEVGQVLVSGTKDVGEYQISLIYNGKWCADRKYNIFVQEDNKKCALELFNERGSEPWSASKKNWAY